MLNRIVVMGRITRDIELRYTMNQNAVASFTVAVDRDKTANSEKVTDFIDCVAWNKAAEFVNKYYKKGSLIVVDGRLQSRKWEDRDGNKRINWEVLIERTYFGEAKKDEYKPAGKPVNVEPPESEFYEMAGSGQGNPFQSPYDQADLMGGELPF